MISGEWIHQVRLGLGLDRSAATLPQGVQSALFTVSGGRIALLGIIGEVTTAIQNQANNTKLISNPTTGTDVDLCAVLSIANKEVGTLFGITGKAGDALVGANAGATVLPDRPVVVAPGTIDLSCAANNTGAIKWLLLYHPIDDGAVAVAA